MSPKSEIMDLVFQSEGKAAPFMTEKLSAIGNGKMSEGIKNLTSFAVKSGVAFGERRGLKKGFILGALGASVLGLLGKWGYDTYKSKKEREILRQKIVHDFDEVVQECQTKENVDESIEEMAVDSSAMLEVNE